MLVSSPLRSFRLFIPSPPSSFSVPQDSMDSRGALVSFAPPRHGSLLLLLVIAVAISSTATARAEHVESPQELEANEYARNFHYSNHSEIHRWAVDGTLTFQLASIFGPNLTWIQRLGCNTSGASAPIPGTPPGLVQNKLGYMYLTCPPSEILCNLYPPIAELKCIVHPTIRKYLPAAFTLRQINANIAKNQDEISFVEYPVEKLQEVSFNDAAAMAAAAPDGATHLNQALTSQNLWLSNFPATIVSLTVENCFFYVSGMVGWNGFPVFHDWYPTAWSHPHRPAAAAGGLGAAADKESSSNPSENEELELFDIEARKTGGDVGLEAMRGEEDRAVAPAASPPTSFASWGVLSPYVTQFTCRGGGWIVDTDSVWKRNNADNRKKATEAVASAIGGLAADGSVVAPAVVSHLQSLDIRRCFELFLPASLPPVHPRALERFKMTKSATGAPAGSPLRYVRPDAQRILKQATFEQFPNLETVSIDLIDQVEVMTNPRSPVARTTMNDLNYNLDTTLRFDDLKLNSAALRTLRMSNSLAFGPLDVSMMLQVRRIDLSNTICRFTKTAHLPTSIEHFAVSGAGLPRIPEWLLANAATMASLKHLNISHNYIGTDPAEWDALINRFPQLETLDYSYNRLSQWQNRFPPNLKYLAASGNDIAAALTLESLPRSLTHLDISNNRFFGSLDLRDLPPNIAYFNVANNRFTGNINLRLLPKSSRFVYLQDNLFTGRPDVSRLPNDCRRVVFGNNSWDSLLPRR